LGRKVLGRKKKKSQLKKKRRKKNKRGDSSQCEKRGRSTTTTEKEEPRFCPGLIPKGKRKREGPPKLSQKRDTRLGVSRKRVFFFEEKKKGGI